MRPNIQITHQLNGRVKDWAAERDLTTEQAYRLIIEVGLEQLGIPEVDIDIEENDEPAAIYSCPDCDDTFNEWSVFRDHQAEYHDF